MSATCAYRFACGSLKVCRNATLSLLVAIFRTLLQQFSPNLHLPSKPRANLSFKVLDFGVVCVTALLGA